MADSIREQNVKAAKTALEVSSVGSTTKPAGLTVHRTLPRPLENDDLPAQVLYLRNEPTEERATLSIDRTLRLAVESRVKASGVSGDEALDPLLTWAVKALMADHTLGGLCHNITEIGTVWDAEQRVNVFASAITEFEISYQTLRKDPEIAS